MMILCSQVDMSQRHFALHLQATKFISLIGSTLTKWQGLVDREHCSSIQQLGCLLSSIMGERVYVWWTCVYELELRKFVIFAYVSDVRVPRLARRRCRPCRHLTGLFFDLFVFWDACVYILISRIADVQSVSFPLYAGPHLSCVYDIVMHQEIDIVILFFWVIVTHPNTMELPMEYR